MLEGTTRKRLAPYQLSPEAFAVIAFLLDRSPERSGPLVSHPDWRLFLLFESSVERMLMECHQRRWLDYQVAGAIHRIEFATTDYEEYVRGILERGT